MKVKDFLNIRPRPVIKIAPNKTIHTAIQKLVKNNIGALPVCDSKGVMLGIITERDLLKVCSQLSAQIHSTRVKDVMTKEVAIGIPEDDIDYVMATMTQKGIRHLPIMDGIKLVGMISARDIVENQLEESKADVRYLSEYIEILNAILQP